MTNDYSGKVVDNVPLYGWRCYSLYSRSLGFFKPYQLNGMRVTWTSSKLQAECKWGECHDHLSHNTCRCGIYMAWSPEEAIWAANGSILAYCRGWGACVEGDIGARCEFVEIERLFISPLSNKRAHPSKIFGIKVEKRLPDEFLK